MRLTGAARVANRSKGVLRQEKVTEGFQECESIWLQRLATLAGIRGCDGPVSIAWLVSVVVVDLA